VIGEDGRPCLDREARRPGGRTSGRCRRETPHSAEGYRRGGAEGRQRNVEDLQAIKEILAEGAALDRFPHVAHCGGDDAVWLESPSAAEPLEFALLEDAEELAWARRLISLTSSRKRTPPAANSICPGLGLVGAGKGAALVAEELGFEELFGRAAQFKATNGPLLRGEAR